MEKWILSGKHGAHQNGLKKNEKCMMKHNEFRGYTKVIDKVAGKEY